MLWIATLLLTFCPFQDKSDRVVLENGDVVSGKVIGAKAGKLKLETPYAKEINLDMKKVRKIETSKPVWIQKKSGELLYGTLSPGKEGQVRVLTGTPEEESILAWSNIRALNPPLGPRYFAKVDLGADLQSGNTNETSLGLKLDAGRTTSQDDLAFHFRWNYGEKEHTLTKRNLFLALEYDYALYNEVEREQTDSTFKSAYLYISSEYLSDHFRSVNYRSITGVGAGFKPISEENLVFSIEGGLAYLFEEKTTGTDEEYITTRVKANIKWNPWEKVTLEDSLTLYPSLKESNLKMRNEASLSWKLGKGWGLGFSAITEYDSDPSGGKKKADNHFLLGLQFVIG